MSEEPHQGQVDDNTQTQSQSQPQLQNQTQNRQRKRQTLQKSDKNIIKHWINNNHVLAPMPYYLIQVCAKRSGVSIDVSKRYFKRKRDQKHRGWIMQPRTYEDLTFIQMRDNQK